MKTLRKVLAIILVICMVMSLASLSAFAAGRPGVPGHGDHNGHDRDWPWGDNDDDDDDRYPSWPGGDNTDSASAKITYVIAPSGITEGSTHGFDSNSTKSVSGDDVLITPTSPVVITLAENYGPNANDSVYTFTGWTINGGTYPSGTAISLSEAGTIILDGSDTGSTELTATANWSYTSDVKFFIRLDASTKDTAGNVQSWPANEYTGVLHEAKISEPHVITGNGSVRAFLSTSMEGGLPGDSTIFGNLNQSIRVNLYGGGSTRIGADEIKSNPGDYTINWYVLKFENDGWHVDGNVIFLRWHTVSYEYVGDAPSGVTPPTGGMVKEGDSYAIVASDNYGNGAIPGHKDGVPGTWTFDGWYAEPDLRTLVGGEEKTMGTHDVVYYGEWSFAPYIPTTGTITIDKAIAGDLTAAPEGLSFTLTGPDGYTSTHSYTGSTITVSDLAPGEYTLTENGADVADYILSVSGDLNATVVAGETAAISITNTYTAEEVPPVDPPPPPYVPTHTLGSVTIEKSSNIMVPDEALFTLYKDGKELASVSYANFINFKYTFTQLEEGTYTVVETGADIAGWDLSTAYSGSAVLEKSTSDNGDTSVSSGSIKVVNTYEEIYAPQTPTLINVEVQKIWVDNSDALGLRPDSISVQLYADGEAYGEPVELDAECDWCFTWYGLDPDAVYTVDELDVPAGYTKSINGYTITNTLNSIVESGDPTLPDLTVNKVDGQGNALAGAVFTLSGEGYATTATSDADGKAVFAAIPVGSYTLSETTAPEGYKAIDKTWTVEVAAEKGDYSISVGEGGIINKVWSWITSIFVDKTAKATLTVVNELLPTPPGPSEPPVEEPEYGSLIITKLSTGAETPADTVFTVTGPEGYKLEVKYSDFVNGTYTVAELLPGTYTVSEGEAKVEGYTLSVEGNDSNAAVAADGEANVLITNTYSPEEPPYVPPVIPDPIIPTPDPDPVIPDPDPVVPDPEPVEPPAEHEVPEEPEEPIEIPEEEVPLAPAPTPVQPGIDLEDIPDEEVPLAQPPQTGDNFLFWLAASILSAIALVFTTLKLRKNEG